MTRLDLTPPRQDLTLYVGDDPRIGLNFWTNRTKTVPLDVSGYTDWQGSIKAPTGETIEFSIDTELAAVGRVIITYEGDELRGFPKRRNRWDIRALDEDGLQTTFKRGRVSIVEDTTE